MGMSKEKKKVIILLAVAVVCIDILLAVLLIFKPRIGAEDIPVTWDKNYKESASDYDRNFKNTHDWTTESYNGKNPYIVVDIPYEEYSTYEEFNTAISTSNMTSHDRQLIMMSDKEAWEMCSDNIFSQYPTCSYKEIKDELADIRNQNTETITIRCWFWANPKDDLDMSKVTKTKTFAVNTTLAPLFYHIFEDIYADPSKPVLNLNDTGMGTWVLRGKNHNSNNTMSAHSIGSAIDINPSTGSFYVNGKWYGNAYGQNVMPTGMWEQLPECHQKYHVLYPDSVIVKTFKAYGFCWGGDWNSTKDPMHFSFIGDGATEREKGQANYMKGV